MRRPIAVTGLVAAALLAAAPVARAEINVGQSLDWLVVSRSAVVIAAGGRVEKVLKGSPPEGMFEPGLPPADAKRSLVFVNAKGKVDYRIDLDRPATSGLACIAFTTDFEILKTGDAVIARTHARLTKMQAAAQAAKAEGKEPPAPPEGAANVFAQQRGFLRLEVPPDAPAFSALWAGSSCYLIVPADAEQRAALEEAARSADPWKRAGAAMRLVNYDDEKTRGLLRSLLTDPEATTIEIHDASGSRRVSVFPARQAAWRALKTLGEELPKPAGWSDDAPSSFFD